jgi:elongation factor 1-gamma
MSLKFYGVPEDFRTAKALITAKFVGVDIAEPPFKFGTDNKGQDYKNHKHPLGKVPVLETKDGCIFESNAIVRYIARLGNANQHGVYGRSAYEQGQVDQWLDFATKEIEPNVLGFVLPLTVQQDKYNPAEAKEVEASLKNALKAMDAVLETRTFFVSERISAADVVLFATLLPLFRNVADAAFRKPYTNVMRWFLTCAAQPQVTGTIGNVPLCEKRPAAPKVAAPAPAPKKEEKKEKKEEDPARPRPPRRCPLAPPP